MTDHSTLAPGLPDLPFQDEARLITRAVTYLGTTAPKALASAIEARDIFAAVNGFSDKQLADLGIDRADIPAYAAKKTGLLDL